MPARPALWGERLGNDLSYPARGSVRNCQTAPKEVKYGQIIEKICIRFDDGIRKSSEDDLLDPLFL